MIRKMSGLSTISYERVRLPKGEEWFLEFDGTGMGGLQLMQVMLRRVW